MKRFLGWMGVLSLVLMVGCGADDGAEEEIGGETAPQGEEGDENSSGEEGDETSSGEEGDETSSGEEGAEEEAGLRMATYNAGIAEQFVSYATERIAPIAAELSNVEADVLCLQEVWSQEAIDSFIEATAETFPHVFYEVTEEDLSDVTPACTAEAVVPLQDCIELNCADSENLASCGTANCIDEFTSLEPGCQGCVASNLNLGVEGVISACVEGGGSLSYGGHNGLMMLSRVEMKSPTLTLLPSFLVQRAWMWAEVGEFTVACTHLATPLTPEYNGEFESYEDEQAQQIQLILGGLSAVEGPTVLLGDMNTGPAVGELDADVAENWVLFGEAGFTDPNVEMDPPFCTWCEGNTLSQSTVSLAIDHVLVRGANGDGVFRFLDGTVDITVGEETLTTSYSDHYGLGATITAPAE